MRHTIDTTAVTTLSSVLSELKELKDLVKQSEAYPVSVHRDNNAVTMKLSESVLDSDETTIVLDGSLLDREFLESPETKSEDIQSKMLVSMFIAGRTFAMSIPEFAKVDVLKDDSNSKPYPRKEEIQAQVREYIDAIAREEIALAYQR